MVLIFHLVDKQNLSFVQIQLSSHPSRTPLFPSVQQVTKQVLQQSQQQMQQSPSNHHSG